MCGDEERDTRGKENGEDKNEKKNESGRKSGGIGTIRMCHKGEIKSEKSSTTDCNYGAFLSAASLLGEQRENAD